MMEAAGSIETSVNFHQIAGIYFLDFVHHIISRDGSSPSSREMCTVGSAWRLAGSSGFEKTGRRWIKSRSS
jgi:hypothetical protein